MSIALRHTVCRSASFRLSVDCTFSARVTGLFGPSGAGKTTLLEILAGLRRVDEGEVSVEGVPFDAPSRRIHLPPEARRVGYVPQDGALFPHLDVEENLRYGERRAGVAQAPDFRAVSRLLGIEPLLARTVSELSGGERQRVALGRALVSGPRLLLLDEPLANLDRERKDSILPYLRRVRDELRIPMLYVSHSPDEVLALCDEVAVLERGAIVQSGPVAEVFRRPARPSIARMLGVETVLSARVETQTGSLVTLTIGSQRIMGHTEDSLETGRLVSLTIRADDVILLKGPRVQSVSARNQWSGRVERIEPSGLLQRIELDCGFPLIAALTRQSVDELGLKPGDEIWALVKAPHVHVLTD